MAKCLVWFCRNKVGMSSSTDIHFFRVTKDRTESWLRAIGRDQTENLSLHNRICSQHFKQEDMIELNGKIVLTKGAVPSLCLRLRDIAKESASAGIPETAIKTEDKSAGVSLPQIFHECCGNLDICSTSGESSASPNKRKLPSSTSDSEGLRGSPKKKRLMRMDHNYWHSAVPSIQMAEFDNEIEEVIIKEEPKKESTDAENTNFHEEISKIKTEEEIKDEIDIEWHELNAEENPDLGQEAECETKLTNSHTDAENTYFHEEIGMIKTEEGIKDEIEIEWHELNAEDLDQEEAEPETIFKHATKNWFQCEKCDHKAKRRSLLRQHVISRHLSEDEIKWFKCDKCEFKSKNACGIKKHVYNKHLSESQIKWFKCEKCDFRCKRGVALQWHVTNRHLKHDEIRWYKCEKCDYRAKQKPTLKQHMIGKHLSVEEIKWFKCEKCAFTAKNNSYVKAHVLRKHCK